ncbi:MAG: hypothetical protein IT230_02370 [Flavobacteriales bacterium]|nr:hypothetical protein [Flavobacteriales bacterium]
MNKLLSIAALALLPAIHGRAQGNVLAQVNERYRAGDLQGAHALVDDAVKDRSLANSAELWVLRGFIYKDLYKEASGQQADILRDEALASLYMASTKDQARQYTASSVAAYHFLVKTIYNDAAQALNNLQPERAIAYYAKYGESLRRMVPDTVNTRRDVDFKNALGTVYVKLFNENREQLDWYDKAVDTYKQVLVMDSSNYGANYNLATLYYNRGVYNIQRITADNDIPGLQQIQEVSREFFTAALPYMLKAHQMRPNRPETILGLEGIHYSLQDEEQSRHYRYLFEELQHDEQREKGQ